MALKTDRRTVDLSAFPDLVIIYLGMRVNKPRGLRTLLRFGPKIAKSVADQPDGLLLHENMIFSVVPPYGGMRQYWRDFEPRALARITAGWNLKPNDLTPLQHEVDQVRALANLDNA
jgi:hypothetical protein